MAIFKCKMCSHYDGEWCRKSNILNMRCKPHESCPECRIKLTDKLSFRPYQMALPDWLVWLLAKIGLAISLVVTITMFFVTGSFIAVAFLSLVDWEITTALHNIAVAIGCMFITIFSANVVLPGCIANMTEED